MLRLPVLPWLLNNELAPCYNFNPYFAQLFGLGHAREVSPPSPPPAAAPLSCVLLLLLFILLLLLPLLPANPLHANCHDIRVHFKPIKRSRLPGRLRMPETIVAPVSLDARPSC